MGSYDIPLPHYFQRASVTLPTPHSLNLDPEEAGDPKCQTMRSKVLFLDSFSQGLEQLSEMQFLP